MHANLDMGITIKQHGPKENEIYPQGYMIYIAKNRVLNKMHILEMIHCEDNKLQDQFW